MKRLSCVVVALSMVLVGCGGSVCEDLKDASETLADKAEPCAEGGSGGEEEEFDVEQCEQELENCSDEDKEALSDFAGCISDVPTCSPATQDEFGAAVLACAFATVGKISDACNAASAESIRRKAYGFSSAQ